MIISDYHGDIDPNPRALYESHEKILKKNAKMIFTTLAVEI